MLAATLPALPGAISPQRDDWRAIAALVRREAAPGDLALGSVEAMAGYYLGPILTVRQRPIALGRQPEQVVAELDGLARGRSRIWLVPSGDPLMDPGDVVGTTLNRAALTREDREIGGLRLTRLDVRPDQPLALKPELLAVDATFGGAVHLVGYAARRASAAGSPVADLSLDLRLERRLPEDYKLFAHVLDAGGETVAQQDIVLIDPVGRSTSQLEAGTRLRVDLVIGGAPEKLARARAVGVGLYQLAPPGARLELTPPAAENRLVLPLAE
jgi:hypothetical protein